MACQTIAGACPELLDSTERRMGKVPVEGGGYLGVSVRSIARRGIGQSGGTIDDDWVPGSGEYLVGADGARALGVAGNSSFPCSSMLSHSFHVDSLNKCIIDPGWRSSNTPQSFGKTQ